MKTLFITLALTLTACAHERTELDREALLNIIDNARPQPAQVVVVPQSQAPIVNVNNYSGGQQSQQGYAEQRYPSQQYDGQTQALQGTQDHPCIDNEIMRADGSTYTDHRCW
jgi:hypothetical protein